MKGLAVLGFALFVGQAVANSNGASKAKDMRPQPMTLRPNVWTAFTFGRVGQPPYNFFNFNVGGTGDEDGDEGAGDGDEGYGGWRPRRCSLEITDAYCPGDRFVVNRLALGDNGQMVETQLIETPAVPYDPAVARKICAGLPAQCALSTDNPDTAFASAHWSSGSARVGRGQYHVVVKPVLSPYCSGGAFIRLRCQQRPPHPPPTPTPVPPGNICAFTEGGMRVIRTAVPYSEAALICTANGMTLAQLNNNNFVPATDTAFQCTGAASVSWIASWNGVSYPGNGLGLTTGQAAPGGAINLYNDGSSHYVLCQETQ